MSATEAGMVRRVRKFYDPAPGKIIEIGCVRIEFVKKARKGKRFKIVVDSVSSQSCLTLPPKSA